jgi:hypothetical protein
MGNLYWTQAYEFIQTHRRLETRNEYIYTYIIVGTDEDFCRNFSTEDRYVIGSKLFLWAQPAPDLFLVFTNYISEQQTLFVIEFSQHRHKQYYFGIARDIPSHFTSFYVISEQASFYFRGKRAQNRSNELFICSVFTEV